MLNGKNRHPVPSPLCAGFAPLLPVLDDLTDARLVSETRAHLAECAWCRAQRATYNRFDDALRQHFAPDVMPALSIQLMEPYMTNSHDSRDSQDNLAAVATSDAIHDTDSDTDTDDALQITVSPLPIPPRPVRRSWRLATGAAGLAAVLVISLLAGLIFLSHGRPQSPTTNKHATTTSGVVPGAQQGLYAVGMSSPTDGWAMGGKNQGSSQEPAYVLHYTNGHWVHVEAPILTGINVIKMLSPTDGWAVGNGVYHYDGSSWQAVKLPVSSYFFTLSAVSPSDIWIAGDGLDGGHSLILHYDGTSWRQQLSPDLLDNFAIYDISMLSADDGWAVGSATSNNSSDSNGNVTSTGAILRYLRGSWHIMTTLPNHELRAVSMSSATNGWIGGSVQTISSTYPYVNGHPQQTVSSLPVTLHYTSGQWREVPFPDIGGVPASGTVNHITMVSTTDGWMFIPLENQVLDPDNATYLQPSIFHLAQGRWVQVKMPLIQGRRIADVAATTFVGPNEFWGVGDAVWWTGIPSGPSEGYQPTVTPLIVHYKNGSWTVIES